MHIPRLALAVLAAALLGASGPASAADPTPRDRRAALCVAALEASADDLVRQVKAGTESARKPLLDRLTQGAVFVGDSYLNGTADEAQARALVDQAELAQRKLTPAELAARQVSCAAEATRLLAKANALERAVVKRVARKRMDKLLRA